MASFINQAIEGVRSATLRESERAIDRERATDILLWLQTVYIVYNNRLQDKRREQCL